MSVREAAAQAVRSASSVARTLVTARRAATALADFPGQLPDTLDQAYAIQELAIGLWDEPIVGWKVGYIAPALQPVLGAERLAGPIFSSRLWRDAPGQVLDIPVFDGGFAAVEAEFIFRLGADAPADRTDWTASAATSLVETLFVGVETAGSPLADINKLGPTAVASDFGNNAGLILGREIAGWADIADQDLACETWIEGDCVGKGRASDLAGGPRSALAFLLNNLAARGRPARAGDLVSTGAVTGIHDIRAGQSARISFGAFGDILCKAEMARPGPAREPSHDHHSGGS